MVSIFFGMMRSKRVDGVGSLGEIGLSFWLGEKPLMDQEKNSPFECVFDSRSSSRLLFDIWGFY